MIGWMDRWMDATNKMATEKPVIFIKSDAMSSNLTYGCTMSNLPLLPLPPPALHPHLPPFLSVFCPYQYVGSCPWF